MVRREVARSPVGEDRHKILRQQPRAHEVENGVQALRRPLQTPATEHDQEHAIAPGAQRRVVWRCAGRHRGTSAAHRDRARLGRLIGDERLPLEMADLLGNALFDDAEVFALQIGDRPARARVDDTDIERHQDHAAAILRRLGVLLPRGRRQARDREEGSQKDGTKVPPHRALPQPNAESPKPKARSRNTKAQGPRATRIVPPPAGRSATRVARATTLRRPAAAAGRRSSRRGKWGLTPFPSDASHRWPA